MECNAANERRELFSMREKINGENYMEEIVARSNFGGRQKIGTIEWQVMRINSFPEEFREYLGGSLRIIDQTMLPRRLVHTTLFKLEEVVEAIKSLRVRGAPAIGIAAAYGLCTALQTVFYDVGDKVAQPSDEVFFERLEYAASQLASSRPTAVNLFWALDRMTSLARSLRGHKSPLEIAYALVEEARAIHEEDLEMCRSMSRFGSTLVRTGGAYLTHCNAGALATGGYGTALGVFYWAHDEDGKRFKVYADETRPLFQGSRLTSWELQRNGIDVTVICDNMAASIMRREKLDGVFVGADRIAANGDVANKIGTYSVAVNARAHGVPFYVVAPSSTFDLALDTGDSIPIEERSASEVRHGYLYIRDSLSFYEPIIITAPEDVKFYNPAFDVTPSEFITGIITENGIISPVTREAIAEAVGKNRIKEELQKEKRSF